MHATAAPVQKLCARFTIRCACRDRMSTHSSSHRASRASHRASASASCAAKKAASATALPGLLRRLSPHSARARRDEGCCTAAEGRRGANASMDRARVDKSTTSVAHSWPRGHELVRRFRCAGWGAPVVRVSSLASEGKDAATGFGPTSCESRPIRHALCWDPLLVRHWHKTIQQG